MKGESDKHKRQHYVPSKYLEQFAHSNGKEQNPKYYLNAYNRKALKPFPINVDDASQISYFYRISDEYILNNPDENLQPLTLESEYLAENIELNFISILKEIYLRKDDCVKQGLTIFPMNGKDKLLLAEQIVIQFLRHPKMRDLTIAFFENEFPKLLNLFKQAYATKHNDIDIADVKMEIKKDDAVLHADMSYLNKDLVSAFTKDLSNNLWSFIYSPEKKFMTSNNPIVCIQQMPPERPYNLGINQKGAIKFFALSPDLLLVMMDEKITSGTDCKFGVATDRCIQIYHKALIFQSDEVYSYHPFDNNFRM